MLPDAETHMFGVDAETGEPLSPMEA